MSKLKNNVFPLLLLAAAAVLAIAFVMGVSTKRSFQPNLKLDLQLGSNFDVRHVTAIRRDSFMALATRAYGSLLSTTTHGDTLIMTLSNANQLGKDFYNSNHPLLKMKLKDAGFEIKENEAAVTGYFLNKNNSVQVPNDVLVKMMDKTAAR